MGQSGEVSRARAAFHNGALAPVAVLGILAALLTFLFAVGGIIDNEYRNFDSGVIAMAISAGVIVFAGSHLLRRSK